jgi:hypothetical protein
MNVTRVLIQSFNTANLTAEGTATYGYDALNRMTLSSTTPYTCGLVS